MCVCRSPQHGTVVGLDLVQEDYNGMEEVVVALEEGGGGELGGGGGGGGGAVGGRPGQPPQYATLGMSMTSLSTITLKCGGCKEDWWMNTPLRLSVGGESHDTCVTTAWQLLQYLVCRVS